MNAVPTLQVNLQGAAVSARKPSSVAREWRLASRTVRFSAICLTLFYLLAAASPFFASYDPAYQNRAMPDCPPMSLHISPPSEWSRSIFYSHPMHMQDKTARTFAADNSQRLDIHLLSHGHLFTTDSESVPYFMLGSDGLGRDLYSRIVYGSRVSMCVGLIGVLISFSLGITIGALSGYIGGTVDFLIMRWSEIEMSLPSFYFLLALAAVIPSGVSPVLTFFTIVAIMSFISWAGFARIIRGMAASVRSVPFVEAARALGATTPRLVIRHILPNSLGPVIVAGTIDVAAAIIAESTLSFLGLGFPPDIPTW
ncbi:MAG TPA: ABC transporter permease, partial [Candidatus Acidoferrum sp.]|nr:ABC transporter permease [Candidatus Acidoferrum sp.]